jgi:hypothetical protein
MRRTIPLVVTVVAVIVAVLAVMVGVGIGQPTTSHGGTPTDVYMRTQAAPEPCMEPNADGVTAFPQEFELAANSHVLAYFTFEWTRLDRGEYGLLHLELDGSGPGGDSEFRPGRIDSNGTVMWSFPNVAPGPHTVAVYAAVTRYRGSSDLLAGLENCALTVFVIPAA